ncbi:MAG: GNAT family N-acetyltransferase [archaeon]
MDTRVASDSDMDFLCEGLKGIREAEDRTRVPVNEDDKALFLRGISQKGILIAEIDKEPIGFIFFLRDHPIMMVPGKHLWVDQVYVRGKHRGKGVAKELWKQVTSIAKEEGFERIAIDVYTANERSARFHESIGFLPLYTIYTKDI